MDLQRAYAVAKTALCVDLERIEDLEQRLLWMQRMNRAIRGPVFENPHDVEAEVESIRRDVRALRRRIESLGERTLGMVRRAAEGREYREAEAAIAAAQASRDDEMMKAAVLAFMEIADRKQDRWHDIAAARHLDALDQGLEECARVAVELAPIKTGRRRNEHPYMIADFAVQSFTHFTGQKAGFWNGGDGPFMRYVTDLCAAAGIRADMRRPIEAAMRKLGCGE